MKRCCYSEECNNTYKICQRFYNPDLFDNEFFYDKIIYLNKLKARQLKLICNYI